MGILIVKEKVGKVGKEKTGIRIRETMT